MAKKIDFHYFVRPITYRPGREFNYTNKITDSDYLKSVA
ncbi:MAG: hypothetical protein ACJAWS_002270 [Oleiphilaceae bacterium]|jgi:hypothetical protein